MCAGVLERRRPRISTGEQTFGLLFDRNEEFFNALVGQYTALGYSFTWDILRFGEYGVPSTRRRLIWIASCPGEALPSFPRPTHGPGLIAPITLQDALSRIKPSSRHNDPLHNVGDMLRRAKNSKKFPMKAYDDKIQTGTVTTAGSEVSIIRISFSSFYLDILHKSLTPGAVCSRRILPGRGTSRCGSWRTFKPSH